MEIKENQMVVIDDQGNERLVNILLTYHHEERNKDYVLFYEDGNEDEIIAMIYTPEKELIPIEDDEEYEEIEEVLNSFDEDEEEEKENN